MHRFIDRKIERDTERGRGGARDRICIRPDQLSFMF